MKKQVIQLEPWLAGLALNVHRRSSVLSSMLPNEKGHSHKQSVKEKYHPQQTPEPRRATL